MNIIHKRDSLPFIIIENTFDSDELRSIYSELDYLQTKLQGPDNTSSAVDNNGVPLKKNTGIFLNTVYQDLTFSNIHNVTKKLFTRDMLNIYGRCHPTYNVINSPNLVYNTLISYYENLHYYKPHVDLSVMSMVSWFFKEPKNFTGGDFYFPDYDIVIPVRNNVTVIFFSCFKHAVSEIKMLDSSIPGSGRFTVSQFCTIYN